MVLLRGSPSREHQPGKRKSQGDAGWPSCKGQPASAARDNEGHCAVNAVIIEPCIVAFSSGTFWLPGWPDATATKGLPAVS